MMRVTFRNISQENRMIFHTENRDYIVDAGDSADVYCSGDTLIFKAEVEPVEFTDCLEDVDEKTFKGKMLKKLSKKFLQKLPDAALYSSVTYKLTGKYSNVTIEFDESAYAVFDGFVAENIVEMPPLIYVFAQGETAYGTLRVVKSNALNKRKYKKMYIGLLLLSNLLLFVPKLFAALFFMSDFYITRILTRLYKYTSEKRNLIIAKKAEIQSDRNRAFIKVIGIVSLVFVGVLFVYNVFTSEYDVIISKDFQSVVCFDEVFVRMDGSLPADAKKSFLEDYYAYYPLADGEYDMDNYYCYIYEDSEGNRYMWLKDGCAEKENKDKDYEDYENPIVYISVGEENY